MSNEFGKQNSWPFSPEETAKLDVIQKSLNGHSASILQKFDKEVSEREAWQKFQEEYNTDRAGINGMLAVIARKRKIWYLKAGIEQPNSVEESEWSQDQPPPLWQFPKIDDIPSLGISWISRGEYAIIRITKQHERSLVLWELAGEIRSVYTP